MMKHVKYLWYVIRHKWFVFIECCKYGEPILGLMHDMSKLFPSEWYPYVDFFYGDNFNDEVVEKALSSGVILRSKKSVKRAFDVAWLHHQRRNKHHWQYWVLHEDEGSIMALPMPEKYRKEMVADWRGCGKALGKPDTKAWYLANKERIVLHDTTRQWVEKELGV